MEAMHFLECIEQGREPLTNGRSGLRVVRVLEAASQSLAPRGRPLEMLWERVRA